MTLSHRKVLNLLETTFACGWTNISFKEEYAGKSNAHNPDFPAVTTTNCAGHHNVQIFFLTPAGRVLHCLPGYWSPEAFLKEAQLALDLNEVHTNSKLSVVEKNSRFLDLQLEHALEHDARTIKASHLQGFDVWEVLRKKDSDFKRMEGFLSQRAKTTDQVVHERMAERPFLALESFDVASFIAMGKKEFDSHRDGCNGQHPPQGDCVIAIMAGQKPATTPQRRTPGAKPAPNNGAGAQSQGPSGAGMGVVR